MKYYVHSGQVRDIFAAPSSLDAALIFLERYYANEDDTPLGDMICVSERGFEEHESGDDLYVTETMLEWYASVQKSSETSEEM